MKLYTAVIIYESFVYMLSGVECRVKSKDPPQPSPREGVFDSINVYNNFLNLIFWSSSLIFVPNLSNGVAFLLVQKKSFEKTRHSSPVTL